MTITLGWWLVPFAVTIVSFFIAHSMCDGESGGFMDMSAFFNMVTYMLFFVIPSLVAWLIWAVFK